MLEKTPKVLRDLLAGLREELTHRNYGPGTWSAHEVVAHLIHGDRTDWIPRARWILAKGEAEAFEPFDRAGHAELASSKRTEELLELFELERAANLGVLRGLPLTAENLAKRGKHPALGSVTLSELLCTWVVHDLNHISQVCKALAYQRKCEVGAWEAYLSILGDPRPR